MIVLCHPILMTYLSKNSSAHVPKLNECIFHRCLPFFGNVLPRLQLGSVNSEVCFFFVAPAPQTWGEQTIIGPFF